MSEEALTPEMQAVKNEMNVAFAKSVLMFAMMDIRKNGAKKQTDYMIPMHTAITALDNKFSTEELAEMMQALAKVAAGMFGETEVAA